MNTSSALSSLGRRKAFTLIELLVVVAIIALLMSILLPALGSAKESARAAVCTTHLSGIGKALLGYTADFKDAIVPADASAELQPNGKRFGPDTWATLLGAKKYIALLTYKNDHSGNEPTNTPQGDSILRCPSGLASGLPNGGSPEFIAANYPGKEHVAPEGNVPMAMEGTGPNLLWNDNDDIWTYSWYACNGTTADFNGQFGVATPFKRLGGTGGTSFVKSSRIKRSSQFVAIYDGVFMHNCGTTTNGWTRISARHNGLSKCNIAFWDGHAGPVNLSDLPIGDITGYTGNLSVMRQNNSKNIWCFTYLEGGR
jgi:prepilin-type N-terminal cleavage/methylation domain-containing protein/prepilin-type processing-associated H-X9-DG protein